jgi:4-hydroxy-tetrahydrodipicolinate synthase
VWEDPPVAALGTILTAIVTPFDDQLAVDEQAFVDLMGHLAGHGSDGFVVCGTTGESSTLSVDEHLRVIELAVAERPPGTTVIAGAGSNDTAHAVRMTERATALGADAILSVTPYYNRPNRRGLIGHYEAVASATDKPIVLYNIPVRTGLNMAPDLLAELAQIDGIEALKQANDDELRPIDGLQIYAGNDNVLARTLDFGGAGGILVASHVAGLEMRRMADEPDRRAEIDAGLQTVFAALSIAPAAVCVKAALNALGLRGGRVRLPYADADEQERATIREMLERRGMLTGAGA